MSIHVKGGRYMRTNEELAVLVQQGDRQAAGELWEQVRRLVILITARYFPICQQNNIDPSDLEQEGYFAVMRAAKAYNPGKRILFSSYLEWHVRNVAREALGLRGRRCLRCSKSLDEPIPTDDGFIFLYDAFEDEIAAQDMERLVHDEYLQQLRAVMNERLDKLKPKQRAVIHARFWEGKSMRETAKDVGLTFQRVQQLEQEAFAKLRLPQSLRKLQPFMYV
jgi:RNA polymerase sigma factor (sigma-70 family)